MLASISLGTAVLAAALLTAAGAHATARAADPHIARGQELVALISSRVARRTPTLNGKQVAFINARRPITGERTVMPVIGQAVDRSGRAWLRVRLPGRTLGIKPPPEVGWISASATLITITPWHVVVDLGARRVLVYHDGRLLRSYLAVVGAASTPTPMGQYFVEENVKMPAAQPGAPFALATSDRSHVFQEFEGGPGQIAIHGIENLGGTLGTAASHGCIRLATSAITWLAARIQPGVPVTVT